MGTGAKMPLLFCLCMDKQLLDCSHTTFFFTEWPAFIWFKVENGAMVQSLCVRDLHPLSAPHFLWQCTWLSRHYDRICHPSAWRAACTEWYHLGEWAMASWYRARFQFLSWCDHERLSLSVASIHSHQHLLYLFLLLKQLSTLDMMALWADLARTFPIRRVWIKIGDDKYDKTQPSIANGHQFLIIFM